MRFASLAREAWRNVASGTAKAAVIAGIIIAMVFTVQLMEYLTVRAIDQAAADFVDAGANIHVLRADGAIDAERCLALADWTNVTGAGVLRKGDDRLALSLPGTSIPAYEVAGDIPEILGAPISGGVVASRELAEVFGAQTGSRLALRDGVVTIGGVYEYPQDGRQTGLGFAMLEPVLAQGPFDACWVQEWPVSEELPALLRAVSSAENAEYSQLNPTLGTSIDTVGAFDSRITRWMPIGLAVLSALLAFGGMRLRRLELAGARHLGLRAADVAAIAALEASLVAAAVLLTGSVSAAVMVAASASAEVDATFVLAFLAPLAAASGMLLGGIVGALSVRERAIMRFFAER